MECDWTGLQPAPYFDLYEGFYLVEDIHYFIDISGNVVYIEYGEDENNGGENGDNEDGDDFDDIGDGEDENNGGGNGDNDNDGDDFEDIGDGDFEHVPENDDFWNDIDPPPPEIVIQIRG